MTPFNLALRIISLAGVLIVGAILRGAGIYYAPNSAPLLTQPKSAQTPIPASKTTPTERKGKFRIALEGYSGCSSILSESELIGLYKRQLCSLGDILLVSEDPDYKIRVEVVSGACETLALSFQVREICRANCQGEKLAWRDLRITSKDYVNECVDHFVANLDGGVLEWKRKER
jgi:hypothetical protein